MSDLPKLPTGTKPPGNVYYFRKISYSWGVLIGGVSVFACLCVSESDVSLAAKITAWSICLLVLVVFSIIDPGNTNEKQVLDETGREVTLRRPIVGWKSTERYVFLDELATGTFDRDHGFEDERFRDVSLNTTIYATFVALTNSRADGMVMRTGGYEDTTVRRVRSKFGIPMPVPFLPRPCYWNITRLGSVYEYYFSSNTHNLTDQLRRTEKLSSGKSLGKS